jgi:cysteinyl-tRNA synthetase
MNFTFDLLAQAKASVERIQSRFDRLREIEAPMRREREGERRCATGFVRAFDVALNDNINTPNALARAVRAGEELNLLERSPEATRREALAALSSVDTGARGARQRGRARG